jgi:hypothetical protein
MTIRRKRQQGVEAGTLQRHLGGQPRRIPSLPPHPARPLHPAERDRPSGPAALGPPTLPQESASASRLVGDTPHPQVQHRDRAVEPPHSIPVRVRAQSVPIRRDDHGKQRGEASSRSHTEGDVSPGQRPGGSLLSGPVRYLGSLITWTEELPPLPTTSSRTMHLRSEPNKAAKSRRPEARG